MKIAFLSSFFPYTTEIAAGNAALYHILEKNNETKLFNFSLLYPETLFPSLENCYDENGVADKVPSEQVLNSINPASYYSTANVIKNMEPDLFLSRYWMPFVGLSLGSVAKFVQKSIFYKKKNIKRIGLIDNMRLPSPQLLDKKNNALYVKNHDAFITFSPEATADLLEINPSALFIEHPFPIYSYVSTRMDKVTARKALGIDDNKKVMLFLDDIREYKGVTTLIEMMANLPETYHLILAGEAKTSFDYFQRLINEHNVNDKISLYIRKINENEVPIFYSATDILLFPVKNSISRNKVFSALNYNLPILMAPIPNMEHIVLENNLGLIIQEVSVETLTTEIINYFEKNLQSVLTSSIQKFKHSASWESVASTIYHLYDLLVEQEKDMIY